MKYWLLITFSFSSIISFAQQFTLSGQSLPSVTDDRTVWADFDNDGDLDLLLCGDDGTTLTTKIFKNENGILTDSGTLLQGTTLNISCADWDNDNDIDLLIGGDILYRNDGNFTFTDIGTVVKADQMSKWADYDNDGDLDLLNIGWIGTGTHLLRNDSGTFVNTNFDLAPGYSGDWADYDLDGDLDFVIGGYLAANDYNGAIIYEQVADTFRVIQGNEVLNLNQMYDSRAYWANTDNDLYPELLVIGNPVGPGDKISLYDRPLTNFFKVQNAFGNNFLNNPYNASFADYDSDGDLDIAVGNYGLFSNNNSGIFSLTDTIAFGQTSWADVDNDNDIDVISTGSYLDRQNNFITTSELWINDGTEKNTAPNSPINPTVSVNGNDVYFHWTKPNDNETSTNQLTYNLYLKDINDNYLIAPRTTENEELLLPQHGQLSLNGSHLIKNLPEGIYRWAVQAIDPNYKASKFSTEKGFSVGQYVHIPDTNFLEAVISLGIDVNNDEKISYTEAKSIQQLDLSHDTIYNSTGIEAFVNLTQLNMSYNEFTQLNISTLDKLEILNVSHCNITNTLFPTDGSLEILDISFNPITNLNVDRLTTLTDLTLSGCALTDINLPLNTNLETVVAQHMTDLTSADLTQNTLIKNLTINHSNLSQIDLIANNLLEDINLDSNMNLVDVCVWKFPFPSGGISVSTAGSPSVYFSPCLNEVYIPDNNFKQAIIANGVDENNDGFITYSEALPITELFVGNSNISDLTGLNAFKNLQLLNADINQIESFDFDSIPLMKSLSLANNQINSISIDKLDSLTFLKADDNLISAIDVSFNELLEEIDLQDNKLTTIKLDSLHDLKYLNLSRNNAINQVDLSNNSKLISLELSNTSISTVKTQNARQLIYLNVDSCSLLSELHLKSNLELKTLLVGFSALTELDLKNNNLLSQLSLSHNLTLETVCIWQQPFPPSGMIFTPNNHFNTNYSLCEQLENTWIKTTDLPSDGIRFMAGFSVNDTVYVGGGFSNDYDSAFYAFDPLTESWSEVAHFPGRLTNFSRGFSVNNNGYILTHDDPTGSFWKYTSSSNTWRLLPAPTTGGKSFVAGFVNGNNIYVHGGTQNNVKSDEFWMFDTELEIWTQLSSGPPARFQAIGFSKDTVGFILTGVDENNQLLGDFWRYNIPSDTWTQLDDITTPRKEAVAVTFNNQLLFGGGNSTGGVLLNDWFEYLPGSDTIIQRTDLPSDLRSGAIAISNSSNIYFGTGYGNSQVYNDWWKYKTVTLTVVNEIPKLEHNVLFAPNPCKTYINSNLPLSNVTLYDLQGKQHKLTQRSNTSWEIPLELANGIYIVNADYGGQMVIEKVVVSR